MRKKIIVWCLSVIMASLVLLVGMLYVMTDSPVALFRFVRSYVAVREKFYKPVSDETLWNGATKGLFDSLGDPHSGLLTGNAHRNFMSTLSPKYGGIGVLMGENADGHVEVLTVFPEGSAHEAGLQVGDILLSVNGKAVEEIGLDETASEIRGEAGTVVNLVIRRGEEELNKEIVRSSILIPTVDGRLLDNDIGYVHIFVFSEQTANELRGELDTLKKAGAKKLIIDLRMNPGGLLDSVVDVASQLITTGPVMSYQLKSGEEKNFYVKGIDSPLPMVVLVDKASASASEILSGAIQDRQEGTIIGETTYGKGTVQEVVTVDKEALVKVSIAEYKTAAGRSIDGIGVTPDLKVEQTGVPFDQKRDSVLQKAIELLP